MGSDTNRAPHASHRKRKRQGKAAVCTARTAPPSGAGRERARSAVSTHSARVRQRVTPSLSPRAGRCGRRPAAAATGTGSAASRVGETPECGRQEEEKRKISLQRPFPASASSCVQLPLFPRARSRPPPPHTTHAMADTSSGGGGRTWLDACTVPCGKVAGIPIRLHLLFPIVLALGLVSGAQRRKTERVPARAR